MSEENIINLKAQVKYTKKTTHKATQEEHVFSL